MTERERDLLREYDELRDRVYDLEEESMEMVRNEKLFLLIQEQLKALEEYKRVLQARLIEQGLMMVVLHE